MASSKRTQKQIQNKQATKFDYVGDKGVEKRLGEIEFAPSSLETIDGAMMRFIDEELNLSVGTNEGFKKVPVLWVTAERAYQIKHNKDLRDQEETLILPLITVNRASVNKEPNKRGTVYANLYPIPDAKGGVITIARQINQKKTAEFQNAVANRKFGPDKNVSSKMANTNKRNMSVQRVVYENEIKQYMTKGKALVFSHGFNIHFGQIVPPEDVDVYMVAPKGPGHLVRRTYQEGFGVPDLIAVQQNPSGKAWDYALAHACGIGGGRSGVIETTFKEETETDLFGEQVVLCGGLVELAKSGFETLVEAGYQPEIAYFECLHELKLITDMIYQVGIQGMRKRVSDTAEYGDLTRGPRVINDDVRKEMKKILTEIQDGQFAKEWIEENQAGRPVYTALSKKDSTHMVETVGSHLRGMMDWIGKK